MQLSRLRPELSRTLSSCTKELWQSVRPVYAAWGRALSAGVVDKKGAQHSKVFSAGKFLIVGSTNWTVSSEANQELSVLLYIEPNGMAFRSQVLSDMSEMARAVTYREIQKTVERVGTHFLTVQERNLIERFRDRGAGSGYPTQFGTVVTDISANRCPYACQRDLRG